MQSSRQQEPNNFGLAASITSEEESIQPRTKTPGGVLPGVGKFRYDSEKGVKRISVDRQEGNLPTTALTYAAIRAWFRE